MSTNNVSSPLSSSRQALPMTDPIITNPDIFFSLTKTDEPKFPETLPPPNNYQENDATRSLQGRQRDWCGLLLLLELHQDLGGGMEGETTDLYLVGVPGRLRKIGDGE
ncbi:hypothetical protein PV08_01447 [Exophiala spinifera]|uniref:Uncharacterized protein n=1 Tax=Exophiala spinifera TaxID=91928 RepID=A0A0D2CBF4_9EURO|nr:uncharacterized protein PV08_01447 [Exophiala spinifera]KIW20869.1 hypothetical protein PV08_01447 [Exophiala spinifera]